VTFATPTGGTKTAPPLPQTRTAVQHKDRWRVPILDARDGGPADRLASRLSKCSPPTVFLSVILAGLAALAGISVALGLLVTNVLVNAWGIGGADERAEVWLAAHRSATRTDASLVGSILAGGVVLPIVAGLLVLALAALRHWRLAAFTIFALGVESGAYRITTLAVHRHRPEVARLESLPVNASYPSGHTAAAIAVYSGLVLLLTSRFRVRAFGVCAWTIAVALPAFVAIARLYRGMHHPLDVAGGLVIGVLALVVVVFACRTADAAAAAR